jgi:hypothetical protein
MSTDPGTTSRQIPRLRPRPALPVTCVAAAITLLAAWPAGAIQIVLGDGNQGFHDHSYQSNEVIYVTGEWDIPDFPPPAIGNVYLVQNDGLDWGTRQIPAVLTVTVKPIEGPLLPGGFVDAILKLPPLPLGNFDIVMDENQDGRYDLGIDYILGDGPVSALDVRHTNLPSLVNVAAIKANSAAKAALWRAFAQLVKTTVSGIDFALVAEAGVHLATETGRDDAGFTYTLLAPAPQQAFLPFALSYNGAVLKIGKEMLITAANKRASVYDAIAADPPDPDYMPAVLMGVVTHEPELATSNVANALVRLANNANLQAAVGDAYRHAYEKFQGAAAIPDHEFTLLQSRQAREYAALLVEVLDAEISALTDLENAIAATGNLNVTFSASGAQAVQQRVTTSGFTASEISTMAAEGITGAEIDAARAAVEDLDLTGYVDAAYGGVIDNLQTNASAAVTAWQGVIADLDAVIAMHQYVKTGTPRANIAGGSTVSEGAGLMLTTSGSSDPSNLPLTYAWDLDGDGEFDDASGTSAQFSVNEQGEYLVGLRATNSQAKLDVAYKRIVVTAVNHIPSFRSTSPPSNFISMLVGGSTTFSAVASDPDADALSFSWFVDGAPAGAGSSYDFAPSADGLYHVEIRASDDSPLSPDNRHVWRVRVDPTGTGVMVLPGGTPARFRVGNSAPNPFNGSTQVDFELPTRAEVVLRVYDGAGRLVRVVAHTSMEAGRYRARWDARDEAGAEVASGVYLLLLEARAAGQPGVARLSETIKATYVK